MITGNPHLARAEILLQQSRHDLAEEHLRLALVENPELAIAHAWLALCHTKAERYTEATREAQQAIGLDPEEPYHHYVLACVYTDRHMPREAMAAVNEALRLDPGRPQFWGLLAALHLDQKRHREALAAAEKGLEIDPEDVMCLNARAAALRGLGRKEAAVDVMQAALARDPEDAQSHANLGWTLLHQGKPRQAMEHFREALRLRPDMDSARAGIVEAMKARWLIYRVFLAYFLFMSRLSGRAQWGIMLGGYFGHQLLRQAARSAPALQPWVLPITIAYVAFALGTWLSVPLFNLLLRTSRFGRLALSREQTIAANALGIVILLPAIAAGIGWGMNVEAAKLATWLWLALIAPVAAAGLCRAGLPRRLMAGYCVLLAVGSLMLLGAEYFGGKPVRGLASLALLPYVWMCLLSPLAVNIINSLPRAPKR